MEPETRPRFTIGELAEERDQAVLDNHGSPGVIGERYEVGPVIGTGGSATVHRAWDRTHRQWVAVKLFHAGAAQVDERRQRKELLILSGLRHPGLVALYDAGVHDDRPYLVMQLISGPTLAARILYGPLPVDDVTGVGVALAEALAHVHSSGVTHRDLKPANVLLGPDGARLSDFGIAQTFDGTRVTASGVVVGTAAYLAPEQVRGDQVGPPADVFSLGLVLLEALTGNREYAGTMAESAVARLHRRPTVPDDLPAALAALLGRMTDDRPERRPAAAEVARELAAVRRGEHVPAQATREHPSGRRNGWPALLSVGLPVTAVTAAVVVALLVGGAQTRAPVPDAGEPAAPAGRPTEPGTQHGGPTSTLRSPVDRVDNQQRHRPATPSPTERPGASAPPGSESTPGSGPPAADPPEPADRPAPVESGPPAGGGGEEDGKGKPGKGGGKGKGPPGGEED